MLSFLPSLVAFIFHEDYRKLPTPDDIYPVWIWFVLLLLRKVISFLLREVITICLLCVNLFPPDRYFCIVYSPALSSFLNPIILVLRGRGMRNTAALVLMQLYRCQRIRIPRGSNVYDMTGINMSNIRSVNNVNNARSMTTAVGGTSAVDMFGAGVTSNHSLSHTL